LLHFKSFELIWNLTEPVLDGMENKPEKFIKNQITELGKLFRSGADKLTASKVVCVFILF